jgi:hypothetical protein
MALPATSLSLRCRLVHLGLALRYYSRYLRFLAQAALDPPAAAPRKEVANCI